MEKHICGKWDLRFLELAKFISNWSRDPSTKVGAVIVDKNHRIVSIGYNGLPQGVTDSNDRLNNRELKYELVVHGELNAILFAKQDLTGCTLYTYPFGPCSRCAGPIIQVGISTVIYPASNNERWAKSFVLTKQMFDEAGIKYIEVNL